jgi:uncharacterized membrane protein
MADHHSGIPGSRTEAVKLPADIQGTGFSDVSLMLMLTAAAMLSMYLPVVDRSVLRFGLAIVLCMFLPGYALLAAVFPRRKDLGTIERMALSAGLSLVISPLIGYGLNYTPLGVRMLPFATFVAAFTCVFLGIAVTRRKMVPRDERYPVDIAPSLREAWRIIMPGNKKGLERTASTMVLVSLVLAALTVAFVAAVPVQHEKYTELYLYGKNSTIAEYPLDFTLGETKPVIVGIANHEGSATAYTLTVVLDAGDGTAGHTLHSDHIVLKDNQTLEKAIDLTPDRAGGRMNMLFLLYVDSVPDSPYRVCNLWVNVSQPA